MYSKILSTWVCLAVLATAVPPSAIVTSGGSVKLNETSIPATAVVSIPMNLGDRLTTSGSDAIIRFEIYGTVITLSPNSAIKTGESNGKPFVRLVAGSLRYKLSADSKLVIFKQTEPVPHAPDGVVTIASRSKTPFIVAGAGGAAAVATTVALVKRSKTCPDGTPKDKDCGNQ